MSGAPRFRRDIQGLRAVAVLSVVAFHATAGAFLTGGFVGVDVFFVISGFLITGILLKDSEQGRFSITGFYRRRIRRLFPALLAVLIFALVAGALILSAPDYRELAATTAATVLFVSNFAFWKLSNYFGGLAEYKPLLHTWSLAVEEQFYVLFPIVLFLLWRFARRLMGAAILGMALVSLALSVWISNTHPTIAFYLAPPRAFELLIGAFLACHPSLMSRLGQRFRDATSLVGLLLILASFILINDRLSFPGAIALAPCLGTAFVIAAGRDGPSIGGRLISFAPFVLFGDISYSLYLWHWPLLVFGRHLLLGSLTPLAEVIAVLLSVTIAYVSWRWIEQPFVRGFPKLKVITAGAVMIAALASVGAGIYLLHGVPQRFSPQSQSLFDASQDYNRQRPRCHGDGIEPIPYDKNCVFGAPNTAPSIAIWADSHGAELAVALGERLAPTQGAVLEITASECPPVLGYAKPSRPNCLSHNTETLRRLVGDPRIRDVLLLANFEAYRNVSAVDFERGFGDAVRALTQAGKKVTIFEPIPTFAYDPPVALGLTKARGGDPAGWGLTVAAYGQLNSPFIALIDRVAKASGATVIPSATLLCSPTLCPAYSKDEGVLYFHATHLSVTGARRLAKAVPLP
jgi:peptidoglycan/LPS O-acetylase OafA/YrhL